MASAKRADGTGRTGRFGSRCDTLHLNWKAPAVPPATARDEPSVHRLIKDGILNEGGPSGSPEGAAGETPPRASRKKAILQLLGATDERAAGPGDVPDVLPFLPSRDEPHDRMGSA